MKRSLGLDARGWFANALATNSRRLLLRRLEGSRHRGLVESEDVTDHYADITVTDEGMRNVLLSFIVARIHFIEARLGPAEVARSTFIDVGDSSGIFIRAMGKRRASVNSSAGAARGIDVVRGDATRLPLRDEAVDYALCFETLEHLGNPLTGLQELYRVCRKGAFVSVPHVSRSTVYPAGFRDAPQELLHVFELSRAHWDALLSHTAFRIVAGDVTPVVGPAGSVKEAIALGLWRALFGPDVFSGTFRRFLVYHLAK